MVLLNEITCAWCWRQFSPLQIRFISESIHLRGDALAGSSEGVRFSAMRFDPEGNALDPDGARCNRLACPHCHGEIPRALLELPTVPISIVGAPSSGKTNLLASGLWRMSQLANDMGIDWLDTDPRFNELIHTNQASLFLSGPTVQNIVLTKTDTGGDALYRPVTIAGVVESAPRPAFYTAGRMSDSARVVVEVYDNAGEHFMHGQAAAKFETSTRHLLRSSAIILVFDPLQHIKFRQRFAPDRDGVGTNHQRQELVFSTVVSQLRRLRGLSAVEPIPVPVIVALSKADVWGASVLGADWDSLVSRRGAIGSLDVLLEGATRMSRALRDVLAQVAPEFVGSVEALTNRAWFVPVSALGTDPKIDAEGNSVLRTSDVRPVWAEVPFALALTVAAVEPLKLQKDGVFTQSLA